MPKPENNFFAQLQQLVTEIGTDKTASAITEPTGVGACGSDTKSPTATADDYCQTANTGERASEMSASVKDYGKGSIDAAPDASASAPSEESRQANIGLTQSGIGNDPSQEDGYVGNLNEPGVGTSTDAKFDDGRKYAAADFLKLPLDRRGHELSKVANHILASIAADASQPAPTGQAKSAAVQPPAASAAAAVGDLVKQAEAGYQLAAVLGMEKLSMAERAEATIAETMRDALLDASLVGEFFKRASEEAAAKKPGDGDGDEGASEGSDGAEASGGASSSGGGGGGGAGDMSAAVDSMAGAPGDAGPGGPGGDAGGGGGISREEMMQQLLMAMQEMGISPEELLQAAAAGGGGGDPMAAAGGMPPGAGGDPMAAAGGMPPGAGGPPPMDPMMGGQPKMAYLQTLAKEAKAFQRSGRVELKLACTPAERGLRTRIKSVLSELIRS